MTLYRLLLVASLLSVVPAAGPARSATVEREIRYSYRPMPTPSMRSAGFCACVPRPPAHPAAPCTHDIRLRGRNGDRPCRTRVGGDNLVGCDRCLEYGQDDDASGDRSHRRVEGLRYYYDHPSREPELPTLKGPEGRSPGGRAWQPSPGSQRRPQ